MSKLDVCPNKNVIIVYQKGKKNGNGKMDKNCYRYFR